MTPDGDSDIQKEMKNTENEKQKAIYFLFSFLNFFKKKHKGRHRQQYGDCLEGSGGGRR